jgi:hypothetical protein
MSPISKERVVGGVKKNHSKEEGGWESGHLLHRRM